MVNNSRQTMYFRKEKALGIVDIRSLGYYNIRHSVLEYNLGEHYEFASFNKLASVYEDMKLANYQMKQKEEARKRRKRKLKNLKRLLLNKKILILGFLLMTKEGK